MRLAAHHENLEQRRGRSIVCYKHFVESDCLEVVTPCEDTDPADQTDPRRLKVPPFVAPGNGKDAWQCL
jgi:hypothetical protein